MRRAHRWIGLLLAAPFFVWAVTGLLFHLKPGWGPAYDTLSISTGAPLPADTLPLPQARAALASPPSSIELLSTALGPVYRVRVEKTRALLNAMDGSPLSPLSAEQAERLAVDAIARSPHRQRYGAPARRELHEDHLELFMDGPGDVVVRVDRRDGSLRQRGADTARVDWLYRLHYGQWTGAPALDRVIPLLLLAGVALLAAAGLALFFAPLLRRTARQRLREGRGPGRRQSSRG